MGVGEVILGIVVVVAVFGLLAMVFGTWITVRVIKAISRGIANLIGGPGREARRLALEANASLRCPRPKCHSPNLPSAKFCRRCGVAMNAQMVSVPARRVRSQAAVF